MDELVPVILGAVLGAVIWRTTRGRTRFVLSVLAVIVAAFAATLSSGEYLESWVYLLLDLGEAVFGLVLGYVVAARLLPARTARDATEAPR
jgi:general stress protein CsbA